MFYQVRAIIFFHSQDEATDFYHDCELALPKGDVMNPGQPDQECGIIDLIKCHHDEFPHEPCEVISRADNCPQPP